MNDKSPAKPGSEETKFSRQVGAQAARKLKARSGAKKSIWFGLGMSGLIGWSVTVPALLAQRSASGSTSTTRADFHGPSCCCLSV